MKMNFRPRAPRMRQRFVRKFVTPPTKLDPGNDPEHPSSRSLRLVRKLHPVIVAAPERVVVNSAMVLIGLGAFIADEPGSVLHWWPVWLKLAFTIAMALGGSSVLYGMFRQERTVERLGYLLVAPSCLIYAIAAIAIRGLPGIPAFLIFFGVALSKIIRLVISSAERDLTIEMGERISREHDEDSDQEDS